MSDLRVFNGTSGEELAKRSADLKKRCDLVLAVVFGKGYDVRQAFDAWLTGLLADTQDPVWLLHEEPLILVAEYLGMDTRTIHPGDPLALEYEKLARKQGW